MPVGVSKVKTPSSQLPFFLLFHRDPFALEPSFPICQFSRRDRKRNMQLAVSTVRRLDLARRALLEQQQHLMRTALHRTAAPPKLCDHLKSKCLFVKTNGPRDIAYIQRRFKNAIRFRRHRPLPFTIAGFVPPASRWRF